MDRTTRIRAGRNIVLISETGRFLAACRKCDVRPIIVKGMALLHTVYVNNPGLRPMSDVDVFIRPREMGRLERILESLGYSRQVCGEPHFHKPPEGERQGTVFDIHDGLPYMRRRNFMKLWERTVKINIHNEKAEVLHPADALVYSLYHVSVQHGDADPFWMRDLDLMIRSRDFTWEEAAGLIRQFNLGLPAAVFLERLRREKNTPVPARVIRSVWPRGVRSLEWKAYEWLTTRGSVPELGHLLGIFTRPGITRLFYVMRYPFISPGFAGQRYGGSGIGAFFDVFLRPARGAVKLGNLVLDLARPSSRLKRGSEWA